MTSYLSEERAHLRRRRAEQAIGLARQSRWQEAAQVNQDILELFPDDVDACNRLGKALTELGRFAEAKQAYARAVGIDPNNTIARRNLERLAHIKVDEAAPVTERVDPDLFIEETGKTGLTPLVHVADREVLAQMAAGEMVQLSKVDKRLIVESLRGDYLGEIEPKLGLRLATLMEGGNRYAAALATVSEKGATVIIKETFRHPSQANRPSFPPRRIEGFRPYTRESLLKHEAEEDEEEEDGEDEEEEGYSRRESVNRDEGEDEEL